MTWMIEIKNKLPRVLSCFFEDSKNLRAHLYYRPVVLQLGSLPKDRQKIPFQPSINSGSLHWNDVVSFDDLLFRFLLDLRVFLTFTPLNEFKFTLDFWLPIHTSYSRNLQNRKILFIFSEFSLCRLIDLVIYTNVSTIFQWS